MSFIYQKIFLSKIILNQLTNNHIKKTISLQYSLQVQRPELYKKRNDKWRMSLSASAGLKGSLTAEAAFVMTLFMFAVTSLLYIFFIFQIQIRIQYKLENAAEKTAEYASLTLLDKSGCSDSVLSEAAKGAMLAAYAKNQFMDEQMTEMLDNSFVEKGSKGISFLGTTVLFHDDLVDIVIHYKINTPISVFDFGKTSIVQRVRRKAFTGKRYQSNSEEDYVYVTKNGAVYHATKQCTYLNPSIKSVEGRMLEQLRNSGGEKYYSCERCVKQENKQTVVYVTDWGNRYHETGDCSSLYRLISRIKLSEAKEQYTPCSKCGGR